jgi:AcrR family transcriptional regulator
MAETELFKNLPAEKRERVFGAAAEEFAANGYGRASMNALVRAAGISKGSLFQYFGTKQGLFDSVVTMATRLAKERLRRTRDETGEQPLRDRLAAVMRAGFGFVDAHPHLARIYFRLLQGRGAPFGAARLQALHRRSVDFIHDLLVDARSRGEVGSGIDLRRAAFVINGILQQQLLAYTTEHVDCGLGLYRGDQQEVEAWIETALSLVVGGLTRRGEEAR